MSSNRLPISFARCLTRMLNGEVLKASEITSKPLLKTFLDDGIIVTRAAEGRRHTYLCPNPVSLHNYLLTQYDIISIESYIRQWDEGASDGQQSLEAVKSTKALRESGLQGFFIKAFNTNLSLAGEAIPTLPKGVELFVHHPEKLEMSPSALVVGVENPECFVKFHRLRHLFPQEELVVVMRYMSLSPNRWLASVSNAYLHFGDFDPSGISIYIHEFRNKLAPERCSFFVPENIGKLINRFGSALLYDSQVFQLQNIKAEDYPEVGILIRLLHHYGKGLEQERLLLGEGA